MTPPRRAGPAAAARVGLLGMYGSANLGDTAIQMAVMAALQRRRPEVRFTAVCTDPVDAVGTFGLEARHISGFGGLHRPGQPPAEGPESGLGSAPWPLQRVASVWNIDRLTRDLDMVLVSGSGQIDDFWGGPWEQPMRLLAWASSARRKGKPVAFFGVGVDQLLTRWGRRMAVAALARADLRVLRDPGSLDALRALGFMAECDVCPDPAFHLRPPWFGGEPAAPTQAFAVISPIARNAWPGSDHGEYDAYLGALGRVADALQARGLQVRFVCSQTRMDPPVIAKVQAAMRGDASATRIDTPDSVDAYMRAVRGAHVVVASRLHALILAVVAGSPVVAVSYARKVTQQMADAGLADSCFDFRSLPVDDLVTHVLENAQQHQARRERVQNTADRLRRELDARFDRLAALIPAGTH